MTKEQLDELAEKVRVVFEPDSEYPVSSIDVKAIQDVDGITVTVSCSYQFVPLTFRHLEKLAELFGTRDYNVNNWKLDSACDTCDYGAEYAHEFNFKVPLLP